MNKWKEIADKMRKNHRGIKEISERTGKTESEISDYFKMDNKKDEKFEVFENYTP